LRDAQSQSPSSANPQTSLRDLINGYTWTQVLHAAARLRLADLIAAGPLTAAELAERSGADPEILRRLLNGLVAIGAVIPDGERRYALNAIGEGLREDAPGSLASFALLSGDDYYRAWLGFDPRMSDGVTPFARVFGAPVFAWYSQHPDFGERFNQRMTTRISHYAAAVASASDLSHAQCIVDVGGGHGVLLEAFLARWPQAQGVLFDLPGATARGEQRLAAAGLSERVEVVPGDFFAEVPQHGDVYILSQILHDWNDAQCLAILKNIRRAIASDGRLLIAEMLMPEPVNGPHPAVDLDLLMMVLTGGKERTENQYRDLLGEEKFVLERIFRETAPGGISVLEARPI
jgi:SAM-dependent methyltransferase